MAAWVSSEEPVLAAATAVAGELADPIRLTVLQLLAHEGPHGMTQLADVLAVSPARLGNHLAKLKRAGLVVTEQSGRHVTYRLADPGITAVLDALADFAGGTFPVPGPAQPAERLCYDHAAGRLGVALLDSLLAEQALRRASYETDELALGPAAGETLARFGIDPAGLQQGRRKLATSCLDRGLRRPHLGGALGHAILASLLDEGLVQAADDRMLTYPDPPPARLRQLIPRLRPPEQADQISLPQ